MQEVISFKVPPTKFDADNFSEIIDCQDDITEPLLTKDISESHIAEYIKSQEVYHGLPDIPCHTQAVERHIKPVTEAAEKVWRDGYIRTTLASRKKMPVFENKKAVKTLDNSGIKGRAVGMEVGWNSPYSHLLVVSSGLLFLIIFSAVISKEL